MLLCIQSSEGSELCIRFGREIHSLHCTDVYVEIKLKGHEVQSVSSALMIVRNFRGFLLETGTIAFCLVMCLHGFEPEDHNRSHYVFQGPNQFYTAICRKKSGLHLYVYICIYVLFVFVLDSNLIFLLIMHKWSHRYCVCLLLLAMWVWQKMNWCRMFTCRLISWCLCLRNIGRMYVHYMWSPQWAHLRGCTNLCYCIVEQILRNDNKQQIL